MKFVHIIVYGVAVIALMGCSDHANNSKIKNESQVEDSKTENGSKREISNMDSTNLKQFHDLIQQDQHEPDSLITKRFGFKLTPQNE